MGIHRHDHIAKMWELLPVDIQRALKEAVECVENQVRGNKNTPARECPRCGDGNTIDCREVKGINDAMIGLCVACGYLWCLECDLALLTSIVCGHWNVCANCGEEKDASGCCNRIPWECEHIKEWLAKNHPKV